MSGLLCIHGHFYQPPREDPWLENILPEGTAAPALNWNRRILNESYAPLAWARRMDGQGRILEIVNCYEWMSFNFGPTLLTWLERRAPQVYSRLLEADRVSLERWGHGNAMGQVYHHIILPLASDLDRRAEITWALADFEERFGRPTEGFWLSEAAVDTPSLELLAEYGVKFTILSPRQAEALAPTDQEQWRSVTEHEVDVRRPYRVDLPSGRSIAVFFYNGPLSQAIAFEGLLADGERFWQRLVGQGSSGLLSVGTDGETYGHHHRFGEMALAYVLEQARQQRDGWSLTNYAAYLADNPPKERVRLREASSWSCVHGVERWRSDCGCTDGGHPQWNQKWRMQLRNGLTAVKKELDRYYFQVGEELYLDSKQALLDYGRVLARNEPENPFMEEHFKSQLSLDKIQTCWNLLEMQRFGLSMFASCAWFFDDLARVEPRNALAFCLRAMELCKQAGGPDLVSMLVEHLREAKPNDPRFPTGVELWEKEVWARRQTPATLTALSLLHLRAGGKLPQPGGAGEAVWQGVESNLSVSGLEQGRAFGLCSLRHKRGELVHGAAVRCSWSWEGMDCANIFAGEILVEHEGEQNVVCPLELHWKIRQEAVLPGLERMQQKDWELLQAQASDATLFLEYRTGQQGPQQADLWNLRWPAQAVAYVLQGAGDGNKDFLDFLRSAGSSHPAAPWLGRRLGRMARYLAEAPDADGAELLRLLRRSRNIGLELDLWGVQNVVWDTPELRSNRELAEVVGLAVN
ncbi:MAG: DUF3536 domain-containing protein [Desulfovibrionaceae bacterium]